MSTTPCICRASAGFVGLATIGLGLALTVLAEPTEVKVLCSNGLRAVMQTLSPAYERAFARTVRVEFGPAALLAQRIADGETFDVAVLTPEAMDAAVALGRIAPTSRYTIAQSKLALAIRAGAGAPALATIDDVTRALETARSIGYARQGASAKPFEAIVDRLGLADIRPRFRLRETGTEVGAAVAAGQVEYGVLPVSEILLVPGIALAGVFPAELQSPVVMIAGTAMRPVAAQGAEDLVRFLRSAAHDGVLRDKGMER